MKKKWIIAIVAVATAGVGASLWLNRPLGTAWASFLQGDPGHGGRVFFDKGCIHCHSISGIGGTTAPGLGSNPDAHLTLGQLVGVMWNHAPHMWKSMEESEMRFPEISQSEMVDLFAYLYIARYLDEQGDFEKGEKLLAQKGCDQCHSLYEKAGTIGPDLRKWGRLDHPILWACAMWNHAPTMEKMIKKKGLAWPEFQGNDMVDLLYYIRSVSREPRQNISDLFPADPAEGKELFSTKGCKNCHTIRSKGETAGNDLGAPTAVPRTPTQLAGSMWNHFPEMWKGMQEKGIARPQFSEKEIADLIAYLYAVRYFDEPGDTAAGREIFADKKCSLCHEEGHAAIQRIRRWRGHFSSITMAYIMWRHGPKMFVEMKERNIPWPVFKEREMVDLVAYLNEE